MLGKRDLLSVHVELQRVKKIPLTPTHTPHLPPPKTTHNYLQNCPKFHDTSLFVDVTNNDTNNQHSQIPVLDLGMN